MRPIKFRHMILMGVACALSIVVAGCGGAEAQTTQPATLDFGAPAAIAAMTNARQGEAAVAAWRSAYKTGDFGAIIAMLDDNVAFRIGLPGFGTTRTGKANAIAAFDLAKSLNIRVDQVPITPPMYNGYSTTFEFNSAGTVGTTAVSGFNLLVVFDFLNGKIVRLQEYAAPAP